MFLTDRKLLEMIFFLPSKCFKEIVIYLHLLHIWSFVIITILFYFKLSMHYTFLLFP